MKQHTLAASLATFFTLDLGQAAFAAAQGAGSENLGKMRIFTELDADGDGSLTQAELAQGGKLRFAKADKNKDGFLSHAELRNQMVEKMHQRSSRKMAKLMALRDTDKDGKLSFEELWPASGGSADKVFARMDENDDGTLSAEEFAKIQRHGEKSYRGAKRHLPRVATQTAGGCDPGCCPLLKNYLLALEL